MQDLLATCVYAGTLLFLFVVISPALVAEHTDAQIPKTLLYGFTIERTGRGTLIFELLWLIPILGGGQLVLVLFLLAPASTFAVRLVSAAELVAAAAWIWYLRRLVSRGR